MIGHWLLQLSPGAENALLTHALGDLASTCVVATAAGAASCGSITIRRPRRAIPRFSYQVGGNLSSVPSRYDDVVARFGVARVAAAIRNRILTTQARRVLSVERRALRGAATPTETQP